MVSCIVSTCAICRTAGVCPYSSAGKERESFVCEDTPRSATRASSRPFSPFVSRPLPCLSVSIFPVPSRGSPFCASEPRRIHPTRGCDVMRLWWRCCLRCACAGASGEFSFCSRAVTWCGQMRTWFRTQAVGLQPWYTVVYLISFHYLFISSLDGPFVSTISCGLSRLGTKGCCYFTVRM